MASDVRSFWKGHLRLALVTIPIRLVSATASEPPTRLHQIDKTSNQRIRYQKVAAETGKIVKNDDIVSGIEVEPGRYVLLDDEELAGLKLSTRHTLELSSFVDRNAIDPIYFERPYFVLPDGDIAEEGYRVIRDALGKSGKCGIGQLTMRGRENLVALMPEEHGLVVTTLRYASELKDRSRVFAGIGEGKLRPEMTDMAMKLIDERSGGFDPAQYRDHYADALAELIRAKAEGGGSVDVAGGGESAPAGNVVDFMEALRRSVEGDRGGGDRTRSGGPSKATGTKRERPDAARKKAKSSRRK